MKYTALPSGKQISKIGLGVSRFGTRTPAALGEEMLEMFFEAGGTLIDTARNYYEWVPDGRGKSEEFLGKWLEKNKFRDKMIISTKGGVRNIEKQFFIDLSRGALIREINESLEALRTSYVDIYLLHRDEPERSVGEIMETLQEIAQICGCEYIGVCNWKIERIKAANEYAEAHGLKPIKAVQTWWSLASYTDAMWNDPTTTHMDDETADYCVEKNCFAMAYSSQAKGFFQKACEVGIDGLDPFLKSRILTDKNVMKLDLIKKYCAENGARPTEIVLGYITSNLINGTALVSCSKTEQLKDILECADHILPAEMIEKIDLIEKGVS